eukprot:804162-Pelagomonas_calceolata.AAC.1
MPRLPGKNLDDKQETILSSPRRRQQWYTASGARRTHNLVGLLGLAVHGLGQEVGEFLQVAHVGSTVRSTSKKAADVYVEMLRAPDTAVKTHACRPHCHAPVIPKDTHLSLWAGTDLLARIIPTFFI